MMKNKLVGFLICLMIITPIQLVSGATQNIKIMDNEQPIAKSSVSLDIIDLMNQVNEDMLESYLEELVDFGPRHSGTQSCKDAANFIKNEFEETGLYTYIDPWRFPKLKSQNVVAIYNGTNPNSDAVIQMIAHYDTIGDSPGANDDGSGIAAMLSIANITSKYSFNHTIRFVAVSGEEKGTYGSFYDAKKAYRTNGNIYAVFNLDMIGYANNTEDAGYCHINGPERSRWLMNFIVETAEAYYENLNLKVAPLLNYPADCESYYDMGFDGVQFTHSKPDEFQQLHSPEDKIELINYAYLANITRLALAMTVELASRPIDLQIRITSPYEGYYYFFDIPILKLPSFNIHTSRLRGMTYIFGRAIARVNVTSSEDIMCVLFGIDGYVWYLDKESPYEWRIQKTMYSFFPMRGKRTLSVEVITKSGKTAYDEMDVFIFSLR